MLKKIRWRKALWTLRNFRRTMRCRLCTACKNEVVKYSNIQRSYHYYKASGERSLSAPRTPCNTEISPSSRNKQFLATIWLQMPLSFHQSARKVRIPANGPKEPATERAQADRLQCERTILHRHNQVTYDHLPLPHNHDASSLTKPPRRRPEACSRPLKH
jgi:hypothetical protein